jgi:hypothetical protein
MRIPYNKSARQSFEGSVNIYEKQLEKSVGSLCGRVDPYVSEFKLCGGSSNDKFESESCEENSTDSRTGKAGRFCPGLCPLQ